MHICQMKIKVLYYWVLLHLQCNHHPSSISWKLLNKLNKLTQFQLRGWGEDAVNPSFVFFAITQTVFLIIHAPHFSVNPGFYTHCLSSQAYFQNALFYLYQTKSMFRPTTTKIFAQTPIKEICA